MNNEKNYKKKKFKAIKRITASHLFKTISKLNKTYSCFFILTIRVFLGTDTIIFNIKRSLFKRLISKSCKYRYIYNVYVFLALYEA